MRMQRDLALAQLADAMRKLGLVPVNVATEFELDHDPALSLRPINPETGEHIPPQHDPACLIWRTKETHDRKTNGRGGERRITTAGSDTHARAHADRLSRQEEEFRRNLLRRANGEPKPQSKWPKRKLQSRNDLAARRP